MERRTKTRKLTPAEADKYRRIRVEIEAEKPAISKMAKASRRRRQWIASLVADLKTQRDVQGLSLADLKERTGMDRAALSKLENGFPENPSIETLIRYAEAVGCRLVVQPAK